jgi:hypothetical protein
MTLPHLLIMGNTRTHLESFWNPSGPSEVPYSTYQWSGTTFCRFLKANRLYLWLQVSNFASLRKSLTDFLTSNVLVTLDCISKEYLSRQKCIVAIWQKTFLPSARCDKLMLLIQRANFPKIWSSGYCCSLTQDSKSLRVWELKKTKFSCYKYPAGLLRGFWGCHELLSIQTFFNKLTPSCHFRPPRGVFGL